ncbi:MAG: phosphoglycerate kinase [Pirellulaceae bacterium]
MAKKTIRDLDISGKRVLIRIDFNVPLCEDGSIANDRRIRAALPTIRHCLESNASLVVMSHLGRPAGERDDRLELGRVAYRLQELLSEAPVEVAGSDVQRKADALKPGEVLLLENLRFDPGEKSGDEQFARRLRELGEVYVNDAFATCHRKHASMYAVPKLFPEGHRVIGLLVEKELAALDSLLEAPEQPMVAILGGVKVADKIGAIDTLLDRAQKLLIGGAMAFTFMTARGVQVGASKVVEDRLDLTRRLLDRGGDKLILPQDHVVARKPEATAESKVVDENIPSGWCGLDIGPKTIERYTAAIRGAGTVVWNGPLGKFEDEPFRNGTEAVIRALAESDAVTVVGGGESGEAIEQLDLMDQIDHVSTGGGAFLEYLEKRSLPALLVIDER